MTEQSAENFEASTLRSARSNTPDLRFLYEKWDKALLRRRAKTFIELNGERPPKRPERVRLDGNGQPIIEVGQLWLEDYSPLILVVKGYNPTIRELVVEPMNGDCRFQEAVGEDEFRQWHSPWDLSPLTFE